MVEGPKISTEEIMDDSKIIELYFERDERAIVETQKKYGRYCYAIAQNILRNSSDAEESVNDTYLDAWNSMPPERPSVLKSFLGMLTRRRALDKYRRKTAQKRPESDQLVPLHELEECIAYGKSIDDELAEEELAARLNEFLIALTETERNVFLRRYWYFDSITDICKRYGFGQSKVKMMLARTREKLAKFLNEEGLII